MVKSLGWDRDFTGVSARNFLPPKYSSDEIIGIVPTDYRKPYDVRELVCRVVDNSILLSLNLITEFQPCVFRQIFLEYRVH